jgi:FeS assembly protein IscX
MELNWDNAEDIALELAEKFPDLDPLSLRFTDLHEKVLALPNFKDDRGLSNLEGKLEAIQMAWHEEYQENHGG